MERAGSGSSDPWTPHKARACRDGAGDTKILLPPGPFLPPHPSPFSPLEAWEFSPNFKLVKDLGLKERISTKTRPPRSALFVSPRSCINSSSPCELNLLSNKIIMIRNLQTSVKRLCFKNNQFPAWRKDEGRKKNAKNTYIHRQAPDLEQKKTAWIYFKVSTTIRTT